jgi:hypothetical protein
MSTSSSEPTSRPAGGKFAPYEPADGGGVYDIGPDRISGRILDGMIGRGDQLDPVSISGDDIERVIAESIKRDRFVRHIADDVHDNAVEARMAREAAKSAPTDEHGVAHFTRRYDLSLLINTTMLAVRAKQYGVDSVL